MKFYRINRHLLWFTLFAIAFILPACQIQQNRLIAQTHPLTGEALSAFGWVGVEFSRPMNGASVENAFSISPPVEGKTFWQEDTFWFRPIFPFSKNSIYQASLAGELETADGLTASVDLAWQFNIRQPDLIYFVFQGDSGEIWRTASDGSQPRQLSTTGGNVFDFSPDRSGEWIAFTVQNDNGGWDLWVMDREGHDQRMLLKCGKDICAEPAWSMDRERIAYTREVYDLEANGYQPAQVWTVDVTSGETSQLYQSESAFGHSPTFSPDGDKLATYDTTQNAIRVLDLNTFQESGIPRILPGSGDWSPDSNRLLFTDLLPAENEPFVEIYIADLVEGSVDTAFIEPSIDTDFSQPRWSPDGNWLAVGLRPVNANITKSLWLLSLVENATIKIADDPSANHSAYQWDSWGESLVYQRLVLGGFDPEITIWRWDWKTRETEQILEEGARPQWLP